MSNDTKKQNWLIWNHERGAWWFLSGYGYTPNKSEAGRFSLDAAIEILKNSNKVAGEKPEETIYLDI